MWLHEAFKYFRKIRTALFCVTLILVSLLRRQPRLKLWLYKHPLRALCSEFLVRNADQKESLAVNQLLMLKRESQYLGNRGALWSFGIHR